MPKIESYPRLIFAVILSLIVLLPLSANAGINQKTIVFSLGTGVSAPTGPPDFTRYWGAGPNINADIAYVFGKRFKIGLAADYSTTKVDKSLMVSDAAIINATEYDGEIDRSFFTISISFKMDLFKIDSPG